MPKYQFTSAAGRRIVEKCMKFNTEMCLGCIPVSCVESCLRDEDFRSQYALGEFVKWLHTEGSQHADSRHDCVKVLGLVAIGLADAVRSDREFIDTVESFHIAMNTRFGIDSSDIVGDE